MYFFGLLVLLGGATVFAAPDDGKYQTVQQRKQKKSGKRGKRIKVPIEIGVGPAGYSFLGGLANNQLLHSGVAVSAEAVISNKLLRQNKRKIPKKYRKSVLKQKEMRISHLFMPESIFLSPGRQGVSVYGISFRPIGISLLRARKNLGLNLGFGARLTYAYIGVDAAQVGEELQGVKASTHFLRPGLDAMAEFRVPLGKKNALGIGGGSHFYLPQTLLKEPVPTSAGLDESIWQVSQVMVKFYHQFPYSTRM